MATSVVNPRAQFFANNGRPLIGGRIHTYVAGSSTRARTYKDAAKAQPNTNPIILDGRGEAQIYLAEGVEYKFVVEDSKGALIYTQEPVYGAIWPNAAEWPSDATLSYQYMTEAKAAAGAIGPIKFYDTYAQALADIVNIPDDALIEIARDETRASARTRYFKRAGGVPEFAVNLDQLRLDLLATDDGMGASLVAFKRTEVAVAARNVSAKLEEYASVMDFGAIGDGSYHPLSQRFSTLAAAQFAYANIADEIDSLAQSIDWAAIRSALKAKAGGTVFYPNLDFVVDRTIRVPAGTTQVGTGQWQYWNPSEQTGTTITTYGAGNPQRWTDIDGMDAATFKPLFVFESDNCTVRAITPKTGFTGADAWSAAFYLPAVSRTVLDECNADGCWTHGSIYVDGTWSDLNTTLQALHPYIDARACNELTVNGGLYRGRVSFCIQGTTRTSGSPWVWSPGGCSDIVLSGVALRPLNGSGFSGVPAAAAVRMSMRRDEAGTSGQGVWLINCFFRTGTVPFMFDLDFIERVKITGYGEASSGAESRFSITSNTGVIQLDGRFLRAPIYKDGIAVIANGSPATLDSGTSANGNLSNLFVTRQGANFSGTVMLGNGIRPVIPGGANLGSSTYEFDTAYVLNFRSATGFSFKPNGAQTYGEYTKDRLYFSFGASTSPSVAVDINATDSVFSTNVVGRIIRPQKDNAYSGGTGVYRYTQLYAANGAINTSDSREKSIPAPIDDALLDAWGDVQHVAFQWLAAVAEKGDLARWHFGVIAQQVRDAFDAHGIDGTRYGLLCFDEWEDQYTPVIGVRPVDCIEYREEWIDEQWQEVPYQTTVMETYQTGEMQLSMAAGNRWGVRPDQCAFIEAAYQRRELRRIKVRLDRLEGGESEVA